MAFLQIRKPEGTTSFINLSQAAEIEILSDEECHIKFTGGGVVTLETRAGVNAVVQAIRKEIIRIEDLPQAPRG